MVQPLTKQRYSRIPSARIQRPSFWVGFLLLLVSLISLLGLYTRTPAPVSAQASTLNFQARLLTSSGGIVPDGTYNVEFKLYDDPTAGTNLWTETREFNTDAANLHVEVKSGYLSVYLGDKTAFPTTIDWSDQLYLTMNIGGTTTTPSYDGEMSPRIRLTSVPQAYYANTANTATSLEDVQGSNTGTLQFDTLTTNQDILLPNATGTVALLQNAQTFTGAITFNAAGTGLQVTNDASVGGELTVNSFAAGSTSQFQINATGAITAATGITSSGTVTFSGYDCSALANGGTLTTNGSGELICAPDDGGSGGSSLFIDDGTFTYLTATADDFVLGANTVAGASLFMDVSAGSLEVGNSSLAGSLVVADGNGDTTTIQAGDSSGSLTFTLPTGIGSSSQCLKNSSTPGELEFANCNNGSGGGGAITLQDAYDVSANPEIVLDGTVGGLTVRDNSTPLGANLFEVQNNAGTTDYFAVDASGTSVDGTFTASGTTTLSNLSSIGVVQTNASGVLSTSDLDLQSGPITGTLQIANGGTGATSAQGAIDNISGLTTTGDLLFYDGANSTRLARGNDGECLLSNATTILWGSCGGGGGVTSLETLTGALNLQGTTNQITVSDNGTDTITLALPQDINTTAAVDFGSITTTGNASIGGTLTVDGTQFTNAGATLSTAQSVADVAAGGDIGSAATTVDVKTSFTVNQTTASQTLTLPNPTASDAGRIVLVANTGSTSFAMHGVTLAPGGAQQYIWNGTSWTPSSVDGSGSGATSVGTLDSQTKDADGGVITGNTLYLQTADSTNVGILSTGAQDIAGAKTFSDALTVSSGGLSVTGNSTITGTLSVTSSLSASNFSGVSSGTNTGDISIAGENYLSLVDQVLTANAIDLTSNVTGILPAANGGTGSGFTQFSGPTTSTKTFTLPDASATILTTNAAVTVDQGGTGAASFTANGILYGNNTGAVQSTAAGSDGDCLIANTGSAPTWGSCGGSGTVDTLQDAYDGTTGGTPEIILDGTRGALTIRDNATPISGNLLEIQDNGATATYLGLTSSSMTLQDSSGNNAFVFDSSTGRFRVYENVASPTEYAEMYYESGEAVFAASSGNTRVGSGSGNVVIGTNSTDDSLSYAATGTAAANYSGDNASFTRNFDGDVYDLQGNVVSITDTSIYSTGSSSPNLLYINQDNAGATGNLILAQTEGTTTQFSVNTGGDTFIGGGLQVGGLTGCSAVETDGSGNFGCGTAGATSLQEAYDGSTNPELTLDATRGAVTIRDNSTPLGANLFEVQNNAGTTDYFAVDATGTSVDGTFTASGTTTLSNLNSIGVVQTNASGVLSTSDLDLQSGPITGTLQIANGGTGATSAQGAIDNISGLTTTGDLLFYDGANSTRLARGNDGECLLSNTTTILWGSCGGGGVTDLQGAYDGGNTIILASNNAVRIQDNSTPITGNLFEVTSNGGGTEYLAVSTNGVSVTGILAADVAVATPLLDRATAGVLNIGTTNATQINLNKNVVVATDQYLRLTGGTTRPGSPSEGMLFFDTDTNRLLTYSNGKWQADRGDTVIVAANDSTQAVKDSADYVATGTSDEDVINNALNDADPVSVVVGATKSGKVYLAAGTYTVDASISIPNNTTLSGAGKGTVIQLDNFGATATNVNLITNTDQVTGTGVAIQDLWLDGRRSVNLSGTQRGIYFSNMGGGEGATTRVGSKLTNIWVSNFRDDGLRLSASSNNTITGISSYTNVRYGIYFLSNSRNNTLTGSTFQGSDSTAIRLSESTHNTITGNVVQGQAGPGIFLTTSSNHNTITGNLVSENTNNGIWIDLSSDNLVSSNRVHDNGASDNLKHGVLVSGASSTVNTIADNHITDTAGGSYAISIEAGTGAMLSGNRFGTGANGVWNASGPIDDAGTGTIYGGQTDGSGNYDIQPAGNVEINATLTDITGGLTVSGTSTFNGNVVVGDANTDTLTIASSVSNISFSDASLQTCTLKTDASGVLLCGTDNTGGGGSTLQGAYDASTGGATAEIVVDTTRGALTIRDNATPLGANLFEIQNNSSVDLFSVDADSINLQVNTALAAGADLQLSSTSVIDFVGNDTISRPTCDGTTNGQLYFDTDTDTLLTCDGGKWQADRGDTVIVAASDSTQAVKDSADYVATGTSDEDVINNALDDADPASVVSGATKSGKVYLAAGTYVADGTILIPNNTTLAGAGRGTLIELANIDVTENLIENSDTTTGTGVVIQDLRLDGRDDLNTAGTQNGIYFNNMGDDATDRQGAKLTNLYVNNFRSHGLSLSSSYNSTLIGNTAQGNSFGIFLNSSSHNTLTGNTAQGNDTTGFYLSSSPNNTLTGNTAQGNGDGFTLSDSPNNTLTGNTALGNTDGFYLDSNSNSNTLTGNTVSSNTSSGFTLNFNSSNNTITGNTIHDNGGGADNNGIYLSAADSNTITGNTITDTSATTTNYAINIFNSTSDTNYLANNTLGGGTINDVGTGTIYGGQTDGSGNYDIQPAGSIDLLANTNITGTLTVSGVVTLSNYDCSAADTFLTTNASGVLTCAVASGGGGSGTLQDAYDASGTPALITTSSGTKDVIIRSGTGFDSAGAFQVQDAASNRVLGVDTSSNSLLLGEGSAVNGTLVVSNSTNDNTVTIESGVTSTSYALTLPTSVGSANECLANSGTPGVLTWTSCGGGGTQTAKLIPEFAGGTLTADGTDNSGVMSADYDSTDRRNYYQWTSSQVTSQDYDLVVNTMVPSDYTGSFANLTIATWRDNNTDASATYVVEKQDGTACASGALTFSGTVSTWADSPITVSCTPAANEVLIVRIKTISANDAQVRISDITYEYN